MQVFWVRANLAFGSRISTWRDVYELQRQGVTHVINLQKNRHGKKVKHFQSLWLSFRDDKKPRPMWFYRDALTFYKRAMRGKSSKLFVMCHYGRCRSASLTYFLLRSFGMPGCEAENKIRAVRRSAMLTKAYRESSELFLKKSLG